MSWPEWIASFLLLPVFNGIVGVLLTLFVTQRLTANRTKSDREEAARACFEVFTAARRRVEVFAAAGGSDLSPEIPVASLELYQDRLVALGFNVVECYAALRAFEARRQRALARWHETTPGTILWRQRQGKPPHGALLGAASLLALLDKSLTDLKRFT